MCQRDYLELLSKCELAFIEKVSNGWISGLIKGKRPTIFYKFTRGYPLIPCDWPLWRQRTTRRIATCRRRGRRTKRIRSECQFSCSSRPFKFVCNKKKTNYVRLFLWKHHFLNPEWRHISYLGFLADKLYCADHVQPSFDTAVGMIGTSFWKSWHAVVAIAQQFDSQTVIFLLITSRISRLLKKN